MTKSLHHLVLAAIMALGATITTAPARAQDSPPRWRPSIESVIISAAKSGRNYRMVLSNSRLGEAMLISASLAVPYSDLNLAREPDASELGRRIHVAARLVCLELDRKYPPALYPILDGYDCARNAAQDGMDRANLVIASKR